MHEPAGKDFQGNRYTVEMKRPAKCVTVGEA